MLKERIIFEELVRIMNQVTGGEYSRNVDFEINGGDLVEKMVDRIEFLRRFLEMEDAND